MTSRSLAKEGDLLFYRVDPSSLKDRFIGFLERFTSQGTGLYTHVSMLDNTLDFQYEASVPRIRRSNINWANPHLELWRIKDATSPQIRDMLAAASQEVGNWYGLGDSLHSLLKKGRLTICTQYTIDSAAQGYIDLTEDKGDLLVSPDEFSTYKSISRVA